MKNTVGNVEFVVVADKLFELGRTVTTPGALTSLEMADITCGLMRHSRGDWGEVCREDWEENEVALAEGLRLLSVYRSSSGKRFWIITEADRSVTTVLLPEEY